MVIRPGMKLRVTNWKSLTDPQSLPTTKEPTIVAIEENDDNDCLLPSIEREHVQGVYDSIAVHWSQTRYKPWPKVEEFLKALPSESFIVDVGCGNGKYFPCAGKGQVMIGCDNSVRLIEICNEKGYKVIPHLLGTHCSHYPQVFCADVSKLPIRDASIDCVISIAVLHHISTVKRRIRAISEMSRILRVGGRLLIVAWALEQDRESRRQFPDQDVLVPWHLRDEAARRQLVEEPRLVSRRAEHAVPVAEKRCQLFQRYCHVYKEHELEDLIRQAYPPLGIRDVFYDASNWCVIAERKEPILNARA